METQNNTFYVYEHWRPDTNFCFYVGKGQKKRAWKMRNRNPYHASIFSKLTSMGLAVDVRIIKSNLSEKEAFQLEIEKIAFYGVDNLANMSTGGEGISGIESYNKIPVYCLNDGKQFESATESAKNYGFSSISVSEAARKVKLSVYDHYFLYGIFNLTDQQRKDKIFEMQIQAAKNRKKTEVPKSYNSVKNKKDSKGRNATGPLSNSKPVICVTTGKTFYSASEAAREYKVCKSSLIELCLGKNHRKSVGGLVFKYKESA